MSELRKEVNNWRSLISCRVYDFPNEEDCYFYLGLNNKKCEWMWRGARVEFGPFYIIKMNIKYLVAYLVA